MCHSVSYIYAHCGSARSTKIFACEAGYCLDSGCRADQWTTQNLIISKPSYCPTCYRKREAQIFEDEETETQELQDSIEGAMTYLEKENEKHAKLLEETKGNDEAFLRELGRHCEVVGRLDDVVVGSQRAMQDVADDRAEELKRFREEQGVWGDG